MVPQPECSLLCEFLAFFVKLHGSQKKLDYQFQKLLYDNLWDLYVRD